MKADATLEGRKTVFWLYGFGIGGAERQALAFARYLKNTEGAIAEIWAFEESGPITALCDEAAIPWRVVPLWPAHIKIRDLAAASLRAAFALRAARADVVLPYMTPANILCCASWHISGARTCVWNQRNGGIERIHDGAERFAARRAPALIANSRQGGEFLISTLGARRERVHVIPNAVLLTTPRSNRTEWRARLGADESAFVVTMTANLHRGKDHETLLRAWAIVCQALAVGRPPVLALAGGEGDTASGLRSLATTLGIEKQVIFLGLINDVSGLLMASDAAVLLNRFEDYEGCPNAVIEAMAAGLPVIASDTGGSREALGEELRESLTPRGDERQVAVKLLALARSSALRREWGEGGRIRAESAFSIEATFSRYAALLKPLIAGRPRT